MAPGSSALRFDTARDVEQLGGDRGLSLLVETTAQLTESLVDVLLRGTRGGEATQVLGVHRAQQSAIQRREDVLPDQCRQQVEAGHREEAERARSIALGR